MRGPAALIFFHPDYTVGPGVAPGQRMPNGQPVADYTASGDLHPAPGDKEFSCVPQTVYDSFTTKCNPISGKVVLYKNKQMFYTGSKQKKGGIAHAGQTGKLLAAIVRPSSPGEWTRRMPGVCGSKARIADALEAAYQSGYRRCICGMAGMRSVFLRGSGACLAGAVPGVTVEAALPCPPRRRVAPGAAAAPCASGGGM